MVNLPTTTNSFSKVARRTGTGSLGWRSHSTDIAAKKIQPFFFGSPNKVPDFSKLDRPVWSVGCFCVYGTFLNWAFLPEAFLPEPVRSWIFLLSKFTLSAHSSSGSTSSKTTNLEELGPLVTSCWACPELSNPEGLSLWLLEHRQWPTISHGPSLVSSSKLGLAATSLPLTDSLGSEWWRCFALACERRWFVVGSIHDP